MGDHPRPSRTVCVRFPWATAAMARVTSVVGRRRSSTSVLTDTSISPQAPLGSWKRVRSRVRPSLPTACPTRFNSRAICWLAETISLNVSAIFPGSPVQDPGRRTEKSPSRIVCRLASITLRSADAPSPLPALCPFPLMGNWELLPAATPAGSRSILFMMISRANHETFECRIRLPNCSRRPAKARFGETVEQPLDRLVLLAHLNRWEHSSAEQPRTWFNKLSPTGTLNTTKTVAMLYSVPCSFCGLGTRVQPGRNSKNTARNWSWVGVAC